MIFNIPGNPMLQLTSPPAQIVADTIVRTVELGVRITDAVVAEETTVRSAVPAGLDELATLGRTLHKRRDDVLAYFEHRASNGPTEAINGRLEALRRNALGFRNLINYRIRSLLHSGNSAL